MKRAKVLYNKELRWMEEERERPAGWVLGKENLEKLEIGKETLFGSRCNPSAVSVRLVAQLHPTLRPHEL